VGWDVDGELYEGSLTICLRFCLCRVYGNGGIVGCYCIYLEECGVVMGQRCGEWVGMLTVYGYNCGEGGFGLIVVAGLL
jgi:hypothetical protein